MLAQSGKNALLNIYLVAGIRILAKISVNNTLVSIVEKNAENGLGGFSIVWAIKRERSPWKTTISLFRALS
jgi:hypothetical protein